MEWKFGTLKAANNKAVFIKTMHGYKPTILHVTNKNKMFYIVVEPKNLRVI